MERIAECPSGLSGRVTHLAAGRAGILGDARAMRSGKAAEAILRACWVETLELGPYAFERTAIDWGRVLAADRVFALLMIRVATYGETEELDVRCPQCGSKFVWDLPLLELPVRPIPEESRAAIAAGRNRFEARLSDGRRVFFKLMDGRDQLRALETIQTQGEDLVVAAMKSRVLEVEGLEKKETERFIADLSMGEVELLLEAMDAFDGGVETAFDVYCPTCGAEWEIDLPLDLQRMFVPKKPSERRRARARKARGGGPALPRVGQDDPSPSSD
jgi:hypothetical protein